MIRYLSNFAMSLSPEVLLSTTVRERCIAKLKELPVFIREDLKNAHKASVLVPLCVKEGEVCLLYTLRSSNLSSHSGQVSFPGGKMDPNETVIETALRETEEEIGVPPGDVDIWTTMSPIQGRDKKVIITPVVGQIINFDQDKLTRSVNEVEEIFTIPMRIFCDKTNHGHFMFNNIMIPVFLGGKHTVWGITGMITHFFLMNFLSSNVYEADFLQKKFDLGDLMPSKI